jgi:uncharacterized membrane protein
MHKNKKILLIILLFTFASRLVLLHWNSGEYTDGIIQMTLFTAAKENSFYPPLYSFLILLFNYIFHNLETSAKLISMLAGTLSIIPVYLIAKRIFDEKTVVVAVILFAISPEIWRWQIRIMTDSLFTLFFIWSIYLLLQIRNPPFNSVQDKQSEIRNLCFAWFFAGLASLTRYQGIALVPPLIIVTILLIRQKEINIKLPTAYCLLPTAIIPWLILIWWVALRGFGHFGQYAERVGQTWWMSLLSYLTMAETFILYIPYELTYPVFGFFIYGMISMNRKMGEQENGRIGNQNIYLRFTDSPIHRFNQLFLYFFIIWLIIHAPFESFQYRYFIPIFPFFIILASYGIAKFQRSLVRKTVGIVAIIFSLLFSLTALYFQRDTFGDIKQAAIVLNDVNRAPTNRVYGNELYRPGMDNLKLKFWSGLKIEPYNTETREQLVPGDYIVLHNVYGNIPSELDFLKTRYALRRIYQPKVRTVPLLPDIMVSPPFTSHPACMIFKYFPQEFTTVILQVTPKMYEEYPE